MKLKELFRKPLINRASSIFLAIAALFISLNISHAQNSDPERNSKAMLVQNVKDWVSQQEGVDQSFVEVQANDRRFIVPDCDSDFTVTFAFSSKTNVQVNCESENWQAVLRIQIQADSEVLVYFRSLSQGEVISADDIEIARGASIVRSDRITERSEVEGRILQVDVEKGQMASNNHFAETLTTFITNQALKQGQALNASMLTPIVTPTSETLFEQRFELSQTINAVVTRDLSEGTILTKDDFARPSQAVVVTRLIERGNLIDSSNSRAEALTGRLPNDAVGSPSQLNRAKAKRRLTPGTIIGFSDITIEPDVSAEQSITLQLRRTQFTLTMEAYALEDGYIGDRIRVRNQESGEVIYATVTDIGRVEIKQ